MSLRRATPSAISLTRSLALHFPTLSFLSLTPDSFTQSVTISCKQSFQWIRTEGERERVSEKVKQGHTLWCGVPLPPSAGDPPRCAAAERQLHKSARWTIRRIFIRLDDSFLMIHQRLRNQKGSGGPQRLWWIPNWLIWQAAGATGIWCYLRRRRWCTVIRKPVISPVHSVSV